MHIRTLSLRGKRLSLWPGLSEYAQYRLLEILPGVLVWTTLFVALGLSVVRPLWAIYFIIVFDLYWLVRVVYLLVYLIVSYRRFRATVSVDWPAKCAGLPAVSGLYHLIFLPTAGEPLAVIRSSLVALAKVSYPKDRLLVVLATEERCGPEAQKNAQLLKQEFERTFGLFLVTVHPGNVPGEVRGKGANLQWAGRRARDVLDKRLHIPYERIIVSSFDIDTQPHTHYFSYLAYQYAIHPQPTRTSFQPVPLFNNNIWQSSALMRVAANSTTFWLMTEQARPDRLFTFSSHSMSFRALVDVGYWQNDIVTEDSRIFLQCFLRYDGHYTVTPLYMPVSMDAVSGPTLWRGLRNLYKQQRRWAYGVENFPFMTWNFFQNQRIPFRTKFRYMWNQLEGVYSWATAPLLIFFLGRLPLLVGGDRLGFSLIAQNAPAIIQGFMTFAMVGLLVSAILSTTLLPPRPPGQPRAALLIIILQWLLFPLVMIVFGSIPATDAQTRLMLGKYLGFSVTEKVRFKESSESA